MPARLWTKLSLAMLCAACIASACAHRKIDTIILDEQLVKAAENGDAVQVRQLIRSGARPSARDNNGETALILAARQGSHEVISLLLSSPADVKDLNGALFWASMSEPLVLLVKSGVSLQAPTHQIESIDDRYANTARILLDHGAQVEARDSDGATPLIRAAGQGETAVVKLLLDRGANLSDRDNIGTTAALAAACECSVIDTPDTLDSLRLLWEHGADVETRDNEGITPLISAAGMGRTENVEFLADKRADLEAKDSSGNTALMIAAQGSAYPTAETVKLLLDKGSKIEARNTDGRTALMLAAAGNGYDQIKIVKLLLNRGANVRAKDNHRNTALSLAQKNKQSEIVGNRPEVLKSLQSAMASYH